MYYCNDAANLVWKLFDFSIAPPMLYYAYIPVVFFALFIAARTFYYEGSRRVIRTFSVFAILFAFYVVSLLFAWIAAPIAVVKLSWSFIDTLGAAMFLSVLFFVYDIVNDNPLPKLISWGYLLGLLPIIILAPTRLSMSGFNFESCEAVPAYWLHVYTIALQALIILGVAVVFVKSILRKEYVSISKRGAVLIAGGALALLVAFFSATTFSEYIDNYRFELYSVIGMAIFLGIVSTVAAREKKFSIHMISAQLFVVFLGFIVGSMIFVQQLTYVRYAAVLSLVLVAVIGTVLVRSVKREIRQREEIEELATRLKEVNRIMTHDVKGTLGKHAMLFRALFEGDFGPVPEQAKGFIEQSAKDALRLIDSIMLILKSGSELVFHPSKFDIAALVREVVAGIEGDATKKGLALSLDIAHDGPLMVTLDQAYIKLHVIQNLVANAVNYTLSGSVAVHLEQKDSEHILFSVKDTGVGITKEDAPKMFKEGGHGAHSAEVNVHSTGYGLFSAKRVVDACGGKIWFESEGVPGRGTTFLVELPVGGEVKE